MGESVKYLNSFVDVAETYSPPRVTEHAKNHKEMGVRPGWAMDLMTGFDFTKPQDQARAWKYVKGSKPMLVIGSQNAQCPARCKTGTAIKAQPDGTTN